MTGANSESSRLPNAEPPFHTRMSQPWDIPLLLVEFEARYRDQNLPETYWNTERIGLDCRLSALSEALSGRYHDAAVINLGGSGLVLSAIDTHLNKQRVAIKFPRPVQGKSDLISEMLDKEISSLVELRHPSIVRIHGAARLVDSGTAKEFPYYIMDFLEAQDSSRYFDDILLTDQSLVGLVRAAIDAVRYMHDSGVVHLDIKPENFLISNRTGVPILSDLGTAKHTSLVDETATKVACTKQYAHPDLLYHLPPDPSDRNRSTGSLQRRSIDARWDLFALGKTILFWMGRDPFDRELQRQDHLSTYTRKYLLLLAARMLDGQVPVWLEGDLKLTKQVLKEIAYTSAASAVEDLKKLTNEFSLIDEVPELNSYYLGSLNVTNDSPTTMTDRVELILDHPQFKRLSAITQLGLVSQVYPTAHHTRSEHSIGTFHYTCRFMLGLYYDPLNPFFRQVVSAADIRAALVAALLHDVGQYPLAHELEEIEPGYELFDHKNFTRSIINGDRRIYLGTRKPQNGGIFDSVIESWGTSRERVLSIIDARLYPPKGTIVDRVLHSVLDGPFDADKIDYLQRDSLRLNVPFGRALDIERITRSLTVILDGKGEGVACIGVHEKAKVAAEFVAISRYAMFSQVYWQHAVRCMKAMLARAVSRLLLIYDRKDERSASNTPSAKRRFSRDFERLVLSLPGSLYNETAKQQVLGLDEDDRDASLVAERFKGEVRSDNTMAATDAAVLSFLRRRLEQEGAREVVLLDDLLDRKLYKRLFVFSHERDRSEWDIFVPKWWQLSRAQRLETVELVELEILKLVTATGASSSTVVLDSRHLNTLEGRIRAKLPTILIDVPGSREGSRVPLRYVIEAQRRTAKKSVQIGGELGDHGNIGESSVWKEFGANLRESAGKVRVFCHPAVIDTIEAGVTQEQFVEIVDRIMPAV